MKNPYAHSMSRLQGEPHLMLLNRLKNRLLSDSVSNSLRLSGLVRFF